MPATVSTSRRRIGIVLGVVLLAAVALVVLALPFRGAPADAEAAQEQLTLAADAFDAGDVETATVHVESARGAVDDLRDVTEGLSGRVWSLVPVAGGGVRDVRRLANALHEVTGAAEVAARTYPALVGPEATLFTGVDSVDLPTLRDVLGSVHEVEDHLIAARESLDDVDGDAPAIGLRAARLRDRALTELRPVLDGVESVGPLLDQLPSILGGDGERSYLVAMLNPSEMRYSGGATLTFADVLLEDGRLTLDRTSDTTNDTRAFRPTLWEGVEGNPFHGPFRQRISNANLAPSWPVSGEELLRAWSKVKREEADGLVAVDVVALARLLEVTGPLSVPGHGPVGADNLVELTVGSYDQFDDEETARRKALNRALVPAFVSKLFAGLDAPGTLRALADSADSRHLAMYLRDPEAQQAVADIDLAGDLSRTDADYLGVFSQNLGGTKSDYWQRKVISSDVRLATDGSARVRLEVQVRNEAPPETGAPGDSNYTRRSLDLSLGAFLPRGAEVRRLRWRGEDVEPRPGDYFGRPYLALPGQIPAGGSLTLALTYDVPAAATTADGELVYRLAVDNHPTVRPEELGVTVHWPEGYAATSLPDGWTTTRDGAARYETPVLDGCHEWRLAAGRAAETP